MKLSKRYENLLKHTFLDFHQTADFIKDPVIFKKAEGLYLWDLEDKKYFSRMLTRQDQRSMDLYLMLLAHSQGINEKEFFIDLESMGLSLGMPDSWSDTAIRRQVIKSLKRIESRYNLISVQFFYGKDAWVELKDVSGDTFISTHLCLYRRYT